MAAEHVPSLLAISEEAAKKTPCRVSLSAPFRIGRRVHLGSEAMILTGTHLVGNAEMRCGAYHFAPVEIGEGSWIGARALVLSGVSIGEGCIVAPGAVVALSMPPHTMVAGNPVRVIGKLDGQGMVATRHDV